MGEYNRLLFLFFLKLFFSQYVTMKNSKAEEENNIEQNIIKNVRNFLKLKTLKLEKK